MTDLEKAARLALDALELLEQCNYAQGMLTPDAEEEAWEKSDEAIDALRAALAQQQAEPMGGEVERLMCVLSIQDATIKALSAALQQAEPVSAPPKSFRVGYMTGYADGQRELREKQQAEQKHVFNQAKGGYSNGKPAPTNQRVSGVVAGRDRCDERDQGERGRTGRNGGEVAVTGRTRPAMDQHRSDGSSAGAYGAHEGGGKTYNVLKQQAEPVAELDAISRALGGDAYWMDPPDGGSVTLADQVARANKAGRAFAQQQAEPVAWTTMPDADDWTFISGAQDPNGKLEGKWYALYSSPQQQAEPVKQAEPVVEPKGGK